MQKLKSNPRGLQPLLAPAIGSGLILEKHLEAVLERSHIRVLAALEFETLWNDLDRPALMWCVLASFEAEEKVPWEFWVNAEGIHGTLGIGGRVGSQPLFCKTC